MSSDLEQNLFDGTPKYIGARRVTIPENMLMDVHGGCNIVDSNRNVKGQLRPEDGLKKDFLLEKGWQCYFTKATVTFRQQK